MMSEEDIKRHHKLMEKLEKEKKVNLVADDRGPLDLTRRIEELEKEVKQLKRELGDNDFSSLYMQQPVPNGNTYVKYKWLQFCDMKKILQQGDYTIIHSWDMAFSDKNTADYFLQLGKATELGKTIDFIKKKYS